MIEDKIKKDVVLTLPPLYPEQFQIYNAYESNPAVRFVVCAAGSKAGKTHGATIRLVQHAWENPNSINWWVAPVYRQSEMAYNLVKRLLPKDTFVAKDSELKITLKKPNGQDHSLIEFRSGEDANNLRGFKVHFVVIDEIARVPYDSYVSCMTTLTQTRGKGLFISTPKGHDFFYDLFQRGNKSRLAPNEPDPYPEYISFNLPTYANPYVQREAIEEMKRNIPEDMFRQEVLAEFLDQTGSVFKNIKGCVAGQLEPPKMGIRYIAGVDLARIHDYSVIMIMDYYKKHVVYFDRFNELDWTVQYKRIMDACNRYNNALCVIDATSYADPIVETLRNAGLNLYPYKISSNIAKRELIEKLRVSIEQKHITYPVIPVLLRELEDYEIKITDSGTVKYGAPRGRQKFDDTVISLALANFVVDAEIAQYSYKQVRGI